MTNIVYKKIMIDYCKTREDAEARKGALLKRQQQILEEKKKLDEESERNKRELIGLDQILDGLDFVNSEIPPDFEPTGFTDNVRKILSDAPVPLVPTQVRDALQAVGITGSSSRNLLINVHKVLERIKDELEESTSPEGKTAYKRKRPWAAFSLADLAGSRQIEMPQTVKHMLHSGERMKSHLRDIGFEPEGQRIKSHLKEMGFGPVESK